MPSRTEFLAGLVPIPNTTGDNCSICFCSLTTPVKLPCSHIFDCECIKTWLQGRGINTCPACRATLFDLEQAETVDAEAEDSGGIEVIVPGTLEHMEQIRRALRLSGLQEDRSLYPTTLDTFGMGRFTEASIFMASLFVSRYIRGGPDANARGELTVGTAIGELEVVRGKAVIDTTALLFPRLIAFAHLVPALATCANMPYSQQNLRDWAYLISHLGSTTKAMEGTECDVGKLPEELLRTIKRNMASRIQTPFFANHEEMGGLNLFKHDFDGLLEFVPYVVWKEQQLRDDQARLDEQMERLRKECEERRKRVRSIVGLSCRQM